MRSTILAIVIIGLLIPVRGLSFGTMSSRSSDSALIVMPEQPRNEDSSHYPLGLSFRVGREYPFFQSINQNSGNYMMFVGLRYTLAPSFSVDLDFSTGTEHHTQPGIPLNQQSDMYFLGGVSILQPLASLAPNFYRYLLPRMKNANEEIRR